MNAAASIDSTRIENVRDRRVIILGSSYFITYLGDGIFYVCAALFFVQFLGITPTVYGAVLTTSWVVAMLLGIPVGKVADRVDPRCYGALLLLLSGVAVMCFVIVPNVVVFAVASMLLSVSTRGVYSARAALIGQTVAPEIVTRVRALFTAVSNAGLAIGAVIGGVALSLASENIFRAVFVFDACTFLISAALILASVRTLPKESDEPEKTESWRCFGRLLHDRPYLLLTFAEACLSLHITLIDVALPLWVVRDTAAPAWAVSVVFVINTLMVVAFQYRVAAGVTSVDTGVRYLRRAGIWLALGMAMFGLAGEFKHPLWALGILATASVVQTVGEMHHTSSMTEVSYRMVPSQRYGEYQGLFGMGGTAAEALGPSVITILVLGRGVLGWLMLGLVFCAAAFAVGPIVAAARRSSLIRENMS